jgi:hypothetical protein
LKRLRKSFERPYDTPVCEASLPVKSLKRCLLDDFRKSTSENQLRDGYPPSTLLQLWKVLLQLDRAGNHGFFLLNHVATSGGPPSPCRLRRECPLSACRLRPLWPQSFLCAFWPTILGVQINISFASRGTSFLKGSGLLFTGPPGAPLQRPWGLLFKGPPGPPCRRLRGPFV